MLKISPPLTQIDPAKAWKPWQPSSARPWNLKWAAHLYRRAGFCPSWEELQQAVKAGFEATVERLLAGGEGLQDFDELVDEAVQGLGTNSRSATLTEHQAVWLYRMVHTPHPLRERMTLFWHNHFATSIDKVRQPVNQAIDYLEDDATAPRRLGRVREAIARRFGGAGRWSVAVARVALWSVAVALSGLVAALALRLDAGVLALAHSMHHLATR